MVPAFDHAIIAVPDLSAAEAGWRRLGFTVTPRGRHKGWGTANACVMLAGGYLELLAIRDPAEPLNGLDRYLEAHPDGGLLGWAWSVPSLPAGEAWFADASVPVGTTTLSRWLDLPEGPVEPAFELIVPTVPGGFGVPVAFACRHLTPELVFQPGWSDHANGAGALAALVLPSDDPERAMAPLTALGHRVDREPDGGIGTTVGPVALRLDPTAHGGEVAVAVADLPAAGARLHEAGVAVRHVGDALELAAPGLDRLLLVAAA